MKKLMLLIVAAALSFGVFAEGLEGVYSLKGITTFNGNAHPEVDYKMFVDKTANGYELSVSYNGSAKPDFIYIVNDITENSGEITFNSEEIESSSLQIIGGKFYISTEEIEFTSYDMTGGTPSELTKTTFKGKKQKEGITDSNIGIKNAGEIVTIYPAPAPGYEIESLVVRYGDFDICLNDKYQFIKPAGDVEISATYRKIDGNDDDNPKPTDVSEVNVSTQSVVGEKFHTVLGQPLSEPQTSGVTVVTRTYSDGAVRSSKEVR